MRLSVYFAGVSTLALAAGVQAASSNLFNTLNTVPPTQNISSIPMPSPAGVAVPPQAIAPGAFKLPIGQSKARSLRHHWAVGLDSIPGVTSAGGAASGNAVAAPTALGLRWWATDKLGFDLLASAAYGSQQSGTGVLSPLYSSAPGGSVYGAGLGVRYNVSEPSRDLLVQVLLKASGSQGSQLATAQSEASKTTTVAGFLGIGFEAFVPGWDWFSVEASAGATGQSQSQTASKPAAGQTASGIGLAGSGYSPVNIAVHVYF